MQVVSKKGEVFFVAPTLLSKIEKERISEKTLEKFQTRSIDEEPIRQIPFPIFCFSCEQSIVDVKNQACPSCVIKIKNSSDLINITPTWILGFVAGLAALIVLLFSWLASPSPK